MAGPVKAKMEGGKELQRNLRKLPDATAKNVTRRVLMNAGKPVAEAAKRHVPVDEGHLKDTITVSTKLSKANRRDKKRFGRDDIEVFIGPGPDPAAHLVEFGSSRQAAQPFLRPAWDATKRNVFDSIGDDMWKEIQKAAARRAKKLAKAAGR